MNNLNIPYTNWSNTMPLQLTDIAVAACDHFQVDIGIVIPSMLGMCAASVQGKFEIEVSDGFSSNSFKEPLSLFTIGIAGSSERKSPLFKWLKKPLDDIITEHNVKTSDTRLINAVQRETQEAEIKILRKRILKEAEGTSKRVHMEDQLVSLQKEIEKPILEEARMFLKDTTAIAAADFLQKQKGNTLTIADAEGGSFDAILEDHRLMEMLLSGFSNETISFERSSRASIDIKSPHTSVSILTQSVKLEKLAKRPSTWDEGFIPRCLIFLAEDKAGTRLNAIGPAIPQELEQWWRERLQFLFDYPFLQDEGNKEICHTLQFSQEAARTWGNVARALESEIQEMYPLRAWLGKMAGLVARLAAIYHLFESNNPINEPIPTHHVQTALNLIVALQPHMVEVHRLYFPNPNEDVYNKIVNWLRREQGTIIFFSLRDLQRTLGIKSEVSCIACSQLVNQGILNPGTIQENKRGRRASPVFYVDYHGLNRRILFN